MRILETLKAPTELLIEHEKASPISEQGSLHLFWWSAILCIEASPSNEGKLRESGRDQKNIPYAIGPRAIGKMQALLARASPPINPTPPLSLNKPSKGKI